MCTSRLGTSRKRRLRRAFLSTAAKCGSSADATSEPGIVDRVIQLRYICYIEYLGVLGKGSG